MNRRTCRAVTGTCLLIAIACTGCARPDRAQEAFYRAVGSDDPERVMSLMHPALREQIDRPVLAAWIGAVNERLGALKGVESKGVTWGFTLAEAHWETAAEVKFARGRAASRLQSTEDKIIRFDFQSEQMRGWFRGPKTTDVYQELGRQFISRLLSDRPEAAYELMHPALQDKVTKHGLRKMKQTIAARNGPLRIIRFEKSIIETENSQVCLLLVYRLEHKDAVGTCEIEIEFVGLKGHLVGFRFR